MGALDEFEILVLYDHTLAPRALSKVKSRMELGIAKNAMSQLSIIIHALFLSIQSYVANLPDAQHSDSTVLYCSLYISKAS